MDSIWLAIFLPLAVALFASQYIDEEGSIVKEGNTTLSVKKASSLDKAESSIDIALFVSSFPCTILYFL